MNNKLISARIDLQTKKAFEELCKKNDLTPSQVLRRLIKDYMTGELKDAT